MQLTPRAHKTIPASVPRRRSGPRWAGSLGIALLVALWWLAAAMIGREILLPAPPVVAQTLWQIVRSSRFLFTVAASLARWVAGFSTALVAAVVLATLASRRGRAAELLRPLVVTVRSVPVIAIILLALIWLSVDGVPVFVSLLVSFPLIYQGVLDGLRAVDHDLVDMGRLFHVAPLRRVRHIHIPSALPVILSAITSAIGMSWKAVIAAEVLSQPLHAIGSDMQIAKLYLQTPQVIAWTIIAVCLAAIGDAAIWALDRRANAWRTQLAPTGRDKAAGPTEAPQPELATATAPVGVRLAKVSFSFPGTELFRDLSLEIPAGRVTAVLGRSGTGKTTLLRLIAGDLKPDHGTVEMLPSQPAVTPAVGFVFQEPRLLPWRSVLANVELVLPRVTPATRRAQRRRALSRFLRSLRLPHVAALPGSLSGGMRHRVNLARGFLCGAPVICLDEPFSSQDPATRRSLVGLTRRLEREFGRTVVMVTHDPQEALLLADTIVVLADRHPTSILARIELESRSQSALRSARDRVIRLLESDQKP